MLLFRHKKQGVGEIMETKAKCFTCLLIPVIFFVVTGCSANKTSYDGSTDFPYDYQPFDGMDTFPDFPADDDGWTVCTPGDVQCTGENTYNRCNADGSGWETGLICPPGTSCMGGGCYSPCSWAERNRSSIGCMFYAMDLDQADELDADNSPYAVIASNTDDLHSATVSVQRKTGGTWTDVETQTVAPNTLYTFRMASDAHLEDTALATGAAYRVVSDFPIVAYQFNPIDSADQWSNDASMLLPVHTLDNWYFVSSWHQFVFGGNNYRSYATIIGTQDGTQVTIFPSTATLAGGSVPAIPSGSSHTITLNDGDVLQVASDSDAGDMTGTYIESTAPVAVFGGTECSDIPYLCDWCRDVFGAPPGGSHRENTCAWCDHVEEQMFPLTTWGKIMVASRVPVRSSGGVAEAAFWRVIASEDMTTVNITARPGLTLRFPPGDTTPVVLNRGRYLEFEMTGPEWDPGDALVEADKPILVIQYIEGQECTNLDAGGGGDPAMILMVPVEQYLDKYIFLTPNTYEVDQVVVVRAAGATITLDDMVLTDERFIPVAAGWEVARVMVGDGVHSIIGTGPFGIIAVGYSPYVSYGYPGGLSLEIINPII